MASLLDAAKHKEPAKLLTDWVTRLGLEGGTALDLGCGAGAEAEYLARMGFTVDAIDKNETVAKSAKERCKGLAVNVILGDFLDLKLEPDHYTLITAINSLPFVEKKKCVELIKRLQASLMPGGVAILAVYGPEHEWASRKDMSFWDIEEYRALWQDGFVVQQLEEYKGMWPLVTGGEIFQHRLHLVARKIS
jgi:cyclopropane fatty-acyl-phospholipid synthase-like methyltransferase